MDMAETSRSVPLGGLQQQTGGFERRPGRAQQAFHGTSARADSLRWRRSPSPMSLPRDRPQGRRSQHAGHRRRPIAADRSLPVSSGSKQRRCRPAPPASSPSCTRSTASSWVATSPRVAASVGGAWPVSATQRTTTGPPTRLRSAWGPKSPAEVQTAAAIRPRKVPSVSCEPIQTGARILHASAAEAMARRHGSSAATPAQQHGQAVPLVKMAHQIRNLRAARP